MNSQINSVIVIFGAPNSLNGVLSVFAKNRCDAALSVFSSNNNHGILLTGGYGEHFNKSPMPHFEYQERYLLEMGQPPGSIIGRLNTTDTIDDVIQSIKFCEGKSITQLIVVTSDFHIPRVKILFDIYNPSKSRSFHIEYKGTTTDVQPFEMFSLMKHETESIERLLKVEKNSEICAN